MDFQFTEEQSAWRDEVRAFIKKNATPGLLAEMSAEGGEGIRGPETKAWTKKMVAKGYLGIGWPEEYGGQGGQKGAVERWILQDEMSYAGVPGGSAAISMMGPTILRVADEDMKKEYLPRILKGEVEFALGYSEPNAYYSSRAKSAAQILGTPLEHLRIVGQQP